jgi:APA family basic amino acid/polyamine antiporter
MTVSHCLGQRQSGGFQVATTTLKIVLLTGFAVAGLTLGRGSWSHLSAGSWPARSQWSALAIGLIYVSYAYSGWDGAAYIAGEIRDPVRLLPRCIIGGTLVVIVLYLLVNLVYVYALDPGEITRMQPGEVERVAELAAERMFGRSAANAIATLLGLSIVASVSAFILAGPRVIFAMARDGLFPRFAGRLHERRGIPIWATITQSAIAIAFLWSGTFQQLLDYTSVGLTAVSGLVIASIFPIRRRKDLPHPYRMLLYPLLPILYLALIAWTIAHHLFQSEKPLPAILSLVTLLLGVPLGQVVRYWNRGRSK